MKKDAIMTPESFAQQMSKPRSTELQQNEAMRQRVLSHTAQWLAAQGIREIALFGAGRHTRPLVRQPWVNHAIRVALILDDHPRSPTLGGIRVERTVEGKIPHGIGAIVISSECYEQELYDRARALYPDASIPIVRLYNAQGDTRYESDQTISRLMQIDGLSSNDAKWLVENRSERHDATLPMLPPARTELHLRRYELASELFNSLGGESVADLACGTGYGAELLAINPDITYAGVDIDARTVDYANRRHAGNQRRFFCASACSTPIESNSIDLIASFETIEHIEDTDALLHEFARILKPRAWLVVSTPNQLGPTPFHVHDFGPEDFMQALSPTFETEILLGQLPIDDVFEVDLPPGMWRIDPSKPPITTPDDLHRRPDYLIAVARVSR